MSNQITEQELAICRQMGIPSEEFLKTREAEMKSSPEGGNQLNGQITGEEIAICRQMGVEPKDYLETREDERLKALCQEDAMTLEEAMKKVMKIMGITRDQAKAREEEGRKIEDANTLTDAEMEACKKLAVSPEEYSAHKRIIAGLVYGAKLSNGNGGQVIWD